MLTQSGTILVVGATGSIGTLVTAEAASRGYRVRALARPGADTSAFGDGVEVVARVARAPERAHTSAAADAAGRIVGVRQGHLLATSFHPEVTGDRRIHDYFVTIVREAG